MTLLTRICTAAAGALVLAVASPAFAQDPLDDLAGQISAESRALNQVLERLARPDFARAVVDSALQGDARRFEGLFEGVELEIPDRCVWIADTVEKLTSRFVGFREECRLRTNLTREELLEYILITLRYSQRVAADEGQPPTLHEPGTNPNPVIPPGAYLDELKAHGLVECKLVKKYSSGIFLFPGRPERFCLGRP